MSDFIPRKLSDPHGLSFAKLREDGLAWAQELSGKIWTDYNIHDPGVTILEQLCYALSELAYRTGFPIEDYFTAPDGSIPFHELGFYLPEEVLPCAPITSTDFCRYLYASIPLIEDISIPSTSYGLHQVVVRPYLPMDSQGDHPLDKESLQKIIHKQWYKNRNLCEDLYEVHIQQANPCYLDAEIEIQSHVKPAEIMANIYFRCARFIASDIKTERYDSMLSKGYRLDELFTGPLCPAGFHHEAGFQEDDPLASDVALISEVGHIQGVLRVRRLTLTHGNGKPLENRSLYYFMTVPRRNHRGPLVQLILNGNPILYSESIEQETIHLLRKMEFEYRAFRAGNRLRDQLPPLPEGQYREFSAYRPVGEHFPDIYGVGKSGLSATAPKEYHEGAKQLKNYLFAPEQILQDTLQTLDHFGDLYAVKPGLSSTYFTQNPLSSQLLARIDHSLQRKHRLLDQSLAMYGVVFPTDLWLHIYDGATGASSWMLECKIKYLEELKELSYARSQLTFWLRRIQLLLGLKEDQIPIVLEPIVLRQRDQVLDNQVESLAHWLVLCWKREPFLASAQQQIEAYVRHQVPAHLVSRFIWLNNDEWNNLEQLYIPWTIAWEEYGNSDREKESLNVYSEPLLTWLEQSWDKVSLNEGF